MNDADPAGCPVCANVCIRRVADRETDDTAPRWVCAECGHIWTPDADTTEASSNERDVGDVMAGSHNGTPGIAGEREMVDRFDEHETEGDFAGAPEFELAEDDPNRQLAILDHTSGIETFFRITCTLAELADNVFSRFSRDRVFGTSTQPILGGGDTAPDEADGDDAPTVAQAERDYEDSWVTAPRFEFVVDPDAPDGESDRFVVEPADPEDMPTGQEDAAEGKLTMRLERGESTDSNSTESDHEWYNPDIDSDPDADDLFINREG